MKPHLFFLIFFLYSSNILNAQQKAKLVKSAKNKQTDVFKEYNVTAFLNIDSIKDIEIYNSYNHKQWHINKQSLIIVKSILKSSKANKGTYFKPGHLNMKVTFKNDSIKSFYMYNYSIINDAYDSINSIDKGSFTISLKKSIDWATLK